MSRILNICLFMFCMSIAGCEHIETGEAFTVHVGEKSRINANLSFSIDSVNDYRCPLQYNCIWGGDVKVLCSVYKPFSRIDTAIYLNDRTKNPLISGGYSFRLLKVDPQSQTGERIPQKNYELSIIIEKN